MKQFGCETVVAVCCVLVCCCLHTAGGIDCYHCTSINGKNKACEDTFVRGVETVHLIERNCEYGYFKGTHCIKLSGVHEDGTSVVVRHCSDADWGSHCGDIRYQQGTVNIRIKGCLEACDHDGCNAGSDLRVSLPVAVFGLGLGLLAAWRR